MKEEARHSRVHHLQNNGWDAKGVGQLMLRTRKDDPSKPFITFTTEAVRKSWGLALPRVVEPDASRTAHAAPAAGALFRAAVEVVEEELGGGGRPWGRRRR